MDQVSKKFVARRALVTPFSRLQVCLLALAFACGLVAGTHKKKQADLAPNLIGDTTTGDNGTQIRFAGIPGFTYTIQSSSDGTNWTAVVDTDTLASLSASVQGMRDYPAGLSCTLIQTPVQP